MSLIGWLIVMFGNSMCKTHFVDCRYGPYGVFHNGHCGFEKFFFLGQSESGGDVSGTRFQKLVDEGRQVPFPRRNGEGISERSDVLTMPVVNVVVVVVVVVIVNVVVWVHRCPTLP